MTAPRCYVPGGCYFVTRRTLQGRAFFRPDARARQTAAYLLAFYARRYGIVLHAAVLMSNHLHMLCSDPRGNLPHFLRELHRALAMAFKELRRWPLPLWDGRRPSVQLLLRPEALLDKCVYTLLNPVAASLVQFARQWPGLWGWWGEGEAGSSAGERIERPEGLRWLSTKRWPVEQTLRFEPPPAELLRQWGLAGADGAQALGEQVATLLQQRGEALRREGRRFLGPRAAREVPPLSQPSTDPHGAPPRCEEHPQLAIGGEGSAPGLWAAVRRWWRQFRQAYRQALARWRKQGRACFPLGTVKLREAPGVRIEEQPPPWVQIARMWLESTSR